MIATSKRRSGFTMIEILVVVVIALLMAAIALPSFSRSLEGSRLRTSARAVVTAHKYARNMSVLRQMRMALLFDRHNRTVEVVSIPTRESLSGRSGFLDDRAQRVSEGEPAPDPTAKEDEAEDGGAKPAAITTEEERSLARGVSIADFSSDADVRDEDGVYWVNYYPSGMSDGFTVRLVDEDNRSLTVVSDRISGGVEVSRER